MTLLIAGLLLWTIVHFTPSIGINLKQSCIERLGENGYKGVFSLLIVLSLLLIVFGWRSITPELLYTLPAITKPIALILLLVTFFLFGAAKYPSRIKQVVRHPQLCSVVVWSIAHLLLNGDSRSLVLFGWLAVWAILEMHFINKRDGEWVKEPSPSWGREARGALISLVIFAVVVFAHPYLAGVPVFS